MSPRVLETFGRLFCETGNVALLIQTSGRDHVSDAALFYWQLGGAYPRDFGFGFPLDAGQLASGHPGWRFADPFRAPKPAPPVFPKAPPPEYKTPAPASRERIRWSRLLPTAALVVIAMAVIQLATNSKQTVSAEDGNQTGLGLTVSSVQHQLEIRWNPQSAAIARSKSGVMKITEAGSTQAVPFEQGQLREGLADYTPTTGDVSIRLDVMGEDGDTTSESIRLVTNP
jgi:hypothetical protein